MLKWKKADIADLPGIRQITRQCGAKASDLAAANLFLLQEKYGIHIAFAEGFLVRRYTTNPFMPGQQSYAFPLGTGNPETLLKVLEADARERHQELRFCLLLEEQKEWLARHMPQARFTLDEGDSDYIYSATHLAKLPGRLNHKKKNHVSKFRRTFPDFKTVPLRRETVPLAGEVAKLWLLEHQGTPDHTLAAEQKSIPQALSLWDELELEGMVIMAGGEPAAMIVASQISDGVYDIHFEKSYGKYAESGGFAAINQIFSEYLLNEKNAVWINREEDLGSPGLRKAKLSYHPDLLLKKYSATIP
ncbi:MAG: DUF2156 domain-containing protein [Deltaproteobacteria bacterium]|nr:DUF2156 domain-containing protein [Deltaproteobacteria bacterium]